ncbi:MAG: 16S rRNA (guanine(966)-N(2))-methyltransferase RsmD [Lachnospiraceae bacterium]|nr:16S rRNA (guanine(966)-N(2))-methyltransferase RsmD [Lachnospiraceae bacterium]
MKIDTVVSFFSGYWIIEKKKSKLKETVQTEDLQKMRVIAGKCKSLPLKTVFGREIRPTTDRAKETLFNILQPYLSNCRFLDLFGGSGGIGIEALSRGAAFCCFVEQNWRAAACIKENLQFTKLSEYALQLVADAREAVEQLKNEEAFDIIFMDPPYLKGMEQEVLKRLQGAHCVKDQTLFVIEASLKTNFSWLSHSDYEIIKEKKYKTNVHIFVRRTGGKKE